jgi:hypothetical protein
MPVEATIGADLGFDAAFLMRKRLSATGASRRAAVHDPAR